MYNRIKQINFNKENFIDISGVLDSSSNTIFIDNQGHIHDEGNKIVSEMIYKELRDRSNYLK